MKRLIETAAWTAFFLSWILAAVIPDALYAFAAWGVLIALSAMAVLVRLSLADEDCGYDSTVFGLEAADFDRIIANGGIE